MADEIERLRAYWTRKRGNRPMPDRFEIDPVELADLGLIAHAFIVELPTLRLRVNPTRLAPWLHGARGCLLEHLGDDRGRVQLWAAEAPARCLPATINLQGPMGLARLGCFPLARGNEARAICVQAGLPLEFGDRPDVLSVQIDPEPVTRLPPRFRLIQGGRAS